MQQTKQQVLLLALLEAMQQRESWCGETHVQKCAYVLQDGLSVPLDFDFILYKHGPFSFQLREQLGAMTADKLVEVNYRASAYGPSFEVTPAGHTLLERFPRTAAQYTHLIASVADALATRRVADLERLGTALYVRNDDPTAPPDARARQITALKPHIRPELAISAVREMDQFLGRYQPAG